MSASRLSGYPPESRLHSAGLCDAELEQRSSPMWDSCGFVLGPALFGSRAQTAKDHDSRTQGAQTRPRGSWSMF